jgi:hypothetical protein
VLPTLSLLVTDGIILGDDIGGGGHSVAADSIGASKGSSPAMKPEVVVL